MSPLPDPRNRVFLYCRSGFETECRQEWHETRANNSPPEEGVAPANTAHVILTLPLRDDSHLPQAEIETPHLVFARHLVVAEANDVILSRGDRVGQLASRLRALTSWSGPFAGLWLGAPDSEAGRLLWPLCRAIQGPLRETMVTDGSLVPGRSGGIRAEVVFLEGERAMIGTSTITEGPAGTPWPMGVARLRLPADAPSRAILKLEEALLRMHEKGDWGGLLTPGRQVVDLGAAPGGWSLAMVHRGLTVTAVDRGDLAPGLRQHPQLLHRREDGFHFRPPRPVDWLLCDIADKPRRIADLIGRWGANRLCRVAIFNLKLPMKKRWEEFVACRRVIADSLEKQGVGYQLRFRHLYHDREEVTGVLILDGSGKTPAKGRPPRRRTPLPTDSVSSPRPDRSHHADRTAKTTTNPSGTRRRSMRKDPAQDGGVRRRNDRGASRPKGSKEANRSKGSRKADRPEGSGGTGRPRDSRMAGRPEGRGGEVLRENQGSGQPKRSKTGQPKGRKAGRRESRETGRQDDRETNRPESRETNRQNNRGTGRLQDRRAAQGEERAGKLSRKKRSVPPAGRPR
ncbi:MAG: 23S rRNA (cytidine(2498)-2'-O)-methyltransferase RlmM [Magnetococcales bacterium]|nr:23S rRNA (cytidine(2498)-2'-O)-methyltransferase RlmM [Magnetococcales bacterium]